MFYSLTSRFNIFVASRLILPFFNKLRLFRLIFEFLLLVLYFVHIPLCFDDGAPGAFFLGPHFFLLAPRGVEW